MRFLFQNLVKYFFLSQFLLQPQFSVDSSTKGKLSNGTAYLQTVEFCSGLCFLVSTKTHFYFWFLIRKSV